jgi:hypothetical protein
MLHTRRRSQCQTNCNNQIDFIFIVTLRLAARHVMLQAAEL